MPEGKDFKIRSKSEQKKAIKAIVGSTKCELLIEGGGGGGAKNPNR